MFWTILKTRGMVLRQVRRPLPRDVVWGAHMRIGRDDALLSYSNVGHTASPI